MNRRLRTLTKRLAAQVLPSDELAKVERIPFDGGEFGYDRFGMERESAVLAYLAARLLYER